MRVPSILRPWYVALAVVAWPGLAWAAGVHMRFTPTPETISPGDTVLVEMEIFEADAEFNAFDINLGFDPVRVTYLTGTNVRGPVVLSACGTTFHLFTAGTDQLRINLSLLCANTFMTGPGVIYSVKFRANEEPGPAGFECDAGTQFYRAGFFVNPLECVPGTVAVDDGTVAVDPPAGVVEARIEPPSPNPWAAGVPRFTFSLPRASVVELKIFDVQGRLVEGRRGLLGRAGTNTVAWDPGELPAGVYTVLLRCDSGGSARARWVVVR